MTEFDWNVFEEYYALRVTPGPWYCVRKGIYWTHQAKTMKWSKKFSKNTNLTS